MKNTLLVLITLLIFSGCHSIKASKKEESSKKNEILSSEIISETISNPILSSMTNDISLHTYRFTWSKGHKKVIVCSITFTEQTNATLDVKAFTYYSEDLSSVQPRYLGKLAERKLSHGEVINLFCFINRSRFWDIPNKGKWSTPRWLHGSSWSFEGLRSGQHHKTYRFAPLTISGECQTNSLYHSPFKNDYEYRDSPKGDLSETFYRDKPREEAMLDMLCLYIISLARLTNEIIY